MDIRKKFFQIVNNKYLWIFAFVAFIPFIPYTSCSNVRIFPVQPVTVFASKTELCLKPPEVRERINKILFIVDKSGSNQSGGNTAGNDPNNIRRADNIEAFFNKHKDDPLYQWGYIVFGATGATAEAYISEGPSKIPVFSDASAMQKAIQLQRSVGDMGCTPYLAALDTAKRAIERDIEKNPKEDSVYNVFFMSDGAPNDTQQDPNGGACGKITPVTNEETDPYISAVKSVLRVASDRIFFSTAYYTLPENDPGRRNGDGLEYMAKAGGGKFVDLEDNDEMDFEELLLGPRPESWIMKEMTVYNFNAANCSDGSRDADSDADGICDKDELMYNQLFAKNLNGKQFDPLNRNSIDPNYSDLFALKFKIMPLAEGLKSCNNVEADKDFDLLNSCEEKMIFDNQANGPTDDWDVELKANGGTADPLNPDSDGDGFLDVIEFFTFGLKSAGVRYQNILDPYSGGITGRTIMAQQRHPKAPEKFGPENTDFRWTYTGFNSAGENCYNVDLKNIALFKTKAVSKNNVSHLPQLVHQEMENVILIYYIMTQERNTSGKGYMMYKYQKVKYPQGFSNGLDYENFNAYKVPDHR